MAPLSKTATRYRVTVGPPGAVLDEHVVARPRSREAAIRRAEKERKIAKSSHLVWVMEGIRRDWGGTSWSPIRTYWPNGRVTAT